MTEINYEPMERAMHDAYEIAAKKEGWNKQESCKVSYDELPEANKRTMAASAKAAFKASVQLLIEKAEIDPHYKIARWLKAILNDKPQEEIENDT